MTIDKYPYLLVCWNFCVWTLYKGVVSTEIYILEHMCRPVRTLRLFPVKIFSTFHWRRTQIETNYIVHGVGQVRLELS